jgi:hypothetical protein
MAWIEKGFPSRSPFSFRIKSINSGGLAVFGTGVVIEERYTGVFSAGKRPKAVI